MAGALFYSGYAALNLLPKLNIFFLAKGKKKRFSLSIERELVPITYKITGSTSSRTRSLFPD